MRKAISLSTTLLVCGAVSLAEMLSHLDRSLINSLLEGSRALLRKVAIEASTSDSMRDTVSDAMGEAAYAVLTLVTVIAVGSFLGRRRGRRCARAPAAKLASVASTDAKARTAPTARRRCGGTRPLQSSSFDSVSDEGSAADRERALLMDHQTTETKMLAKQVRDGRAAQLPRFLDAALKTSTQSNGADVSAELVSTKHLLCALRACVAHRFYHEALVAYHHVAGHIVEDCCSVWSILLFCAMETDSYAECEVFVRRLRKYGGVSSKDFVNMTRYYAHQADLQSFQSMLAELKACGFQADGPARSTALTFCASFSAFDHADELLRSGICSAGLDTLTCNMLMSGFVMAKQPERCFAVWNLMRQSALVPSEQTFGILLNACSLKGQFEHANAIIEDIHKSGVSLNVVHYTTLMKNLLSAGFHDGALNVLDEMQAAGVQPDIVAYSTLIKAFADSGNVNSAVDILDRMAKQGVYPTIVIFNTVLGACSVVAVSPTLVLGTLDKLIDLGLKPSTATLSILVRSLAKAKALNTALEVLDSSRARFGIWAEPRVYAQLAQAAVKNGNRHLVRAAHASMWKTAKEASLEVDATTNERMQRLFASRVDGHSAAPTTSDA